MTYMHTSRRSFLASAAAFAAFGARAQGTSSEPIRMVIPFAAGGATDVLGRDLAKAMGATLGQSFVIENAGVLAMQKVTSNTVPGFGYKSWNALFTPAGTPAPVIAQLYAAMKTASLDPGMAKRFEEQGVDIALADAAGLTDMIRKETALWDKVIREANIQLN